MTTILIIFILAGCGILALRYFTRIQVERDRRATAQTYEHVNTPILVCSNFPDDPTVHSRAQAWREKLRASGNKYSESLPVEPYPYALGADPKLGALVTWSQYRANCILKESKLINEWNAEQAKENPGLYNNILNQSSN